MLIYNMVIEITRRCNLQCKHCLRGCCQKDNFNTKYLDNIFKDIDRVCILNFSGGEPLLNVRGIIKTLNYIKEHDIKLDSFYIVCNGTLYSKRLMEVLKDFYDNYCFEKEMCGFSISTDEFHKEEIKKKKLNNYIDKYLELTYQGFNFIYDDRKEINSLILSGRGKRNKDKIYTKYGNRQAKFLNGFFETDSNSEEDNMIYISANGNVISNCDLSYDITDKYSFGNIGKEFLKDIIFRNMKSKNELKEIIC